MSRPLLVAPIQGDPYRIANRYTLTGPYISGRRSMAYFGVDLHTMRPTMIKIAQQSLFREYHTLRHLQHLHCVPKVLHFDDAFADGSQSVLVLEALGQNLCLWPGAVPNTEAKNVLFLFVLCVLGRALSGLSAVHASGVIHGDIKPASILLSPGPSPSNSTQGRPEPARSSSDKARLWFCGFNNARRLNQANAPPAPNTPVSATKVGTITSARYCSPEVMRGCCPTAKDDLYALCMVAFWLLRGVTELPWNEECSKEQGDLEWIASTKEKTRGTELFQGCPSVFCDFYEYVRNIPGGAIPDYAFWIKRFHEERKLYPVKKDGV